MKTLFVDESGNLGMKDRYFILVLFAPQRGKRIVNFMRKFCAKNNLSEVKASRLSFPQKQEIFNKLCSANDYTVSYIVADKQNIENKKLFDDKNLCYNYLFSFLVKKTIKSSSEDLCFLLDNHSIKVGSINSLSDYIKIKAYTQFGYKNDLQISYTNSEYSKVIQAADIIANAIWAHYNYNVSHFYNMLTISESIKFPCSKFGQDTVIPITK
jgi:Protein of unknown function (DUF3800)